MDILNIKTKHDTIEKIIIYDARLSYIIYFLSVILLVTLRKNYEMKIFAFKTP